MGIITPAPLVLGTCSLTVVIELVCLANILAAVGLLAGVSSKDKLTISGVQISPLMQCATAAYAMVGIPLAVYAGVGAVYRVQSHLAAYRLYLLGGLAISVVWLVLMASYGSTCFTVQDATVTHQAELVCTAVLVVYLFMGLCIMLVQIGFIYLVSWMKDYLRQREETELIRYQEPFETAARLADDAAAAAAMNIKKAVDEASGFGYSGWKSLQVGAGPSYRYQ